MITSVILAAGASSRMGQPKQLLAYQGTTLLGHVCKAAMQSNCDDCLVVLGAHYDAIAKELSHFQLKILRNLSWKEGMASSIRTALDYICSLRQPPDGVLLLTADQISISNGIVNEMIDEFTRSPESIVACRYGQESGIPALFPSSLFNELISLKGKKGAKSILQIHSDRIIEVPFPGGADDIDTPEDYLSQLSKSKTQRPVKPCSYSDRWPALTRAAEELENETS